MLVYISRRSVHGYENKKLTFQKTPSKIFEKEKDPKN